MSTRMGQRKAIHFALLLCAVLALSLASIGTAVGEGSPHPQVLGYPKVGCYDVVTWGMGLWGGTGYPVNINVPGPVEDAYLVWLGTEDVGAPNSPNQSDLTVNGTTVIGQLVDRKKYGSGSSEWFMWRANIGPQGANLVQQGANSFTLAGWNSAPMDTRRNGASVVVVYKTGACTRPNQIDLIDNLDWYWERSAGEETTTATTFTFPPAPVDREVTLWLNHAGSDHSNPCRPEQVWAAWGTGTPPANIINYGSPSTGVNGGKLIITNAFSPSSLCGTTTYAPVTLIYGGYIDAEWSITKIKMVVPAGATWLALQAESVKTGHPEVTQTGESGAWFMQASVPLYNPELKVSKTDGKTDANPGDTLTYTINYDNHGYGPAENTKIVDQLPERATFVSATNNGSYDQATRTVTWNLGTLNKGASGQVAVTVKLNPVFPRGTTTVTNVATISTTTAGEQDTSDNTATDNTNVLAKVELAIQKTAAPEPVDAGAPLNYTINWTVAGNAYAPGVSVVDSLPANTTFASASAGFVYNAAARTVTWSLGEVTPVKTGTYTVAVTVDTPLYNGTKLTNNVVIADTAGDSKSASAVSTVRSSHTLAIAKSDTPDPVEAGAQLTYKIDWSVAGNEPAKDAKIVDTLPEHVTLVSVESGSYTYTYDPATRKITWAMGTLNPPKSGTFTVVVLVDKPLYNGWRLTNALTFSDTTPGSQPASGSAETTVHSDHTLTIAKTDSPDPVEKGANLTYTISWGIEGNEPADSVVISDSLPFGTQFVSASNGGAYNPATGAITWNLGNKVPGDTGTLTLVVKVNKDFPNGPDVKNTATIFDSKPGKEKKADAITKVVQTPEGSIGDTVYYDSNGNGVQEPGDPGIGGVRVMLYKAGADGQCGTADDSFVGETVTDGNGQYRFDKLPAGTYCVKVDETSSALSGLALTTAANPFGPINLTEGKQYKDADFGYGPRTGEGSIGDRVWSDADGDGQQDLGEVGIGNVTLNLYKAGTDGQCSTADDVYVATTTTAADGSYRFAGLAPAKYCVKVTDTQGVLAGLTLTGGTNPHGPIDLKANQSYLNADFGYHSATANVGKVGNLVFYDGNRNGVYEPGPTERGIEGVTLSLGAPGNDGEWGTADDIVVGTAVTDGNGNYMFTGLRDGKYRVAVTDLNGRLVGYTQTYGVPNADNNGQVSPYEVIISGGNTVLTADFGYADGHILDVTKINNIPAGQAVEAGANMVYTIGWSVSGREPALNVVIKDPLPTQLDFVSASNGGVYDSTTRLVTWQLGTRNPGESGTVTLTVHVKKPLANNSYIFNTVTIIDDARVTDEATDVVRVHAEPKLTLTKQNDPTGEVRPGDTIKYTLCYANTGNGNATSVVLKDKVPTYTTYVTGSATGGGQYDAATRTLTWSLGTVGPDVSLCVEFKVTVDTNIPGVSDVDQGWKVDNTATLDSSELPQLTASTSNKLNAVVKLSLTKAADPSGEIKPGDKIKYTLCYANSGTHQATGVVLTDAIPNNTTYVTGSATDGGAYDATTNKVTWNIGAVAPGVSKCVSFQVTVNMTISGLGGQSAALSFAEWSALSITNTATLKSDQLPDKTATVTNPLNATVDLWIVKSASASQVHMGDSIVFTVTLTNRGTANANDVVVTDAIHPKLENVTLTTSKGTASYDVATRVWTVTVGTVAPGEMVTIVIKGTAAWVEAETLPYNITNMAQVKFREGNPRNSNEVVVQVVYFLPGEVPEPGTWLMLGSGLAGLAGYARLRMRARRRNAA